MKILICDSFDSHLPKKLSKYGEVLTDMKELSQAEIALVRSKTKCTKEWIDKAISLKMIIRGGVGLDNIDCEYAKEKGICVENTADASSIAVAEMTFAMMLAMPNCLIKAHNSTVAGNWLKNDCKRTELYQKTLGLIGFGRIAKEVAKRANAFGMKIIAYTRTPQDFPEVTMVSLERLISESDYISLHTPLTSETKKMLDAEKIVKMKKGVYLINTGRGECVVETDIATFLQNGHIAGYAADVWENEPPKDSPLLTAPNCLAAPHIAASTKENLHRIGEIIEQKISIYTNKV